MSSPVQKYAENARPTSTAPIVTIAAMATPCAARESALIS
jgi:hypothetical protein